MIEKIKLGDDRSFELLSVRYKPLITGTAHSFDTTAKGEGITGFFADIRQELTYALYKAALSFDTKQEKVTFGLYAKRCLENRAISLLRKFRSEKRRESDLKKSLEKQHGSRSSFFGIPGKEAPSLEKAKEELSSYELSVLEKYLDGMRVADIAREVGRTPKSVSNALFRCRAKVRAKFGASGDKD